MLDFMFNLISFKLSEMYQDRFYSRFFGTTLTFIFLFDIGLRHCDLIPTI